MKLHGLRKRSSVKERYHSFRTEKRVLSTVENIDQNSIVDMPSVNKPEITLPKVNTEEKEPKTKFDSYSLSAIKYPCKLRIYICKDFLRTRFIW